jgi:hypothetical protein
MGSYTSVRLSYRAAINQSRNCERFEVSVRTPPESALLCKKGRDHADLPAVLLAFQQAFQITRTIANVASSLCCPLAKSSIESNIN